MSWEKQDGRSLYRLSVGDTTVNLCEFRPDGPTIAGSWPVEEVLAGTTSQALYCRNEILQRHGRAALDEVLALARQRVEALRAAAQTLPRGTPRPLEDCPVCASLPLECNAALCDGESLPPPAAALVEIRWEVIPERAVEVNRRCPECGAWFRYSVWDRADEREPYEPVATLSRATPLRAVDDLSEANPAEAAQARARLAGDLERLRGTLDRGTPALQHLAGQALAEACLRNGDPAGFAALARDARAHVRRGVVEALAGPGSRDPALLPLLVDLATDPATSHRASQALRHVPVDLLPAIELLLSRGGGDGPGRGLLGDWCEQAWQRHGAEGRAKLKLAGHFPALVAALKREVAAGLVPGRGVAAIGRYVARDPDEGRALLQAVEAEGDAVGRAGRELAEELRQALAPPPADPDEPPARRAKATRRKK